MIEKHTPGPWFAALDPTNFPELVHTKSPKGHCPGKLVGVGKAQPDGDFSEACANSRLIAACADASALTIRRRGFFGLSAGSGFGSSGILRTRRV